MNQIRTVADIKQYAANFNIIVALVDTDIKDSDFNKKNVKYSFTHPTCNNTFTSTYTNFRKLQYKCKSCPKIKAAAYFDINEYAIKTHSRNKNKSKEEITKEVEEEIKIYRSMITSEDTKMTGNEKTAENNKTEDVKIVGGSKKYEDTKITRSKGGPLSKFTIGMVNEIFNKRGFEVISKNYKGNQFPLKVMHIKCKNIERVSVAELKRRKEEKTCPVCDNYKLRAKTSKKYLESDDDDEDTKQDIKPIAKLDIKQDIKQDINQDTKKDIEEEEEFNEETVDGIKSERKEEKKRKIPTKNEILAQIKELGYEIEGEYTNSRDILNFIHECGYEEKMSWSILYKRSKKENYCGGCSNFKGRERKFDLNNTLENLKDVEEKYNLICMNTGDIDRSDFDAIFKCVLCGVIKNVKFNKNSVRKCQSCSSIKSRGELFCKKFLETLFDKKFVSIRPKFLIHNKGKPLELDCYNDELKLALEFQGIQHDKYIEYLHKYDKKKFKDQQDRDAFKKQKCIEHKISLLEVTYIDMNKGEDFVKQKIIDSVNKFGYSIDNVEEKKRKKIEIEGGVELCVNLDIKIANKLRELNYRLLRETKEKHSADDHTILICNNGHHFITTYDNFGNKPDNRCPYCSKKRFTTTYLNHNMYIRGWPMKTTSIKYNKNHPKKSKVVVECNRCKTNCEKKINVFKRDLFENIYPCPNLCALPPPPVITEHIYNILYNELYAKKMEELESRKK